MDQDLEGRERREPWNKGKLVGQKAPLRLKDIWAIRVRLQLAERTRELALFNLAVDSKRRSCDLVKLRVRDVTHGDRVASRAIVMARPVRDYRTDPRCRVLLDRPSQASVRGLLVPQSVAWKATPLDAPIRSDRPRLGKGDWA